MVSGSGFSELASGSLPVLDGDPLQPSWSRSLQELKAASEALLGSAQTQQSTSTAHALLGNRDDFRRITASLESTEAPKIESFVSVEETLRLHRDNVLERILSVEREQTRRKSQELVEKQLREDWVLERDWWLKELVGTRTLGGSAIQSRQHHSGSLTGSISIGVMHGDPSSSLDAKMIQAHLDIVKNIDMEKTSLLPEVLSKFHKLPMSAGSVLGYNTAWQLLSSMLPNISSPIDCALGGIIHFCKQFQNHVIDRVRKASLAGQDVSTLETYGTGMVSTVATFVKLEFGANASIWHIIYFCLRCGNAAAAMNALEANAIHEGAIEAPVRTAIAVMSQRQSNASCLWERGPPIVSPQDRQVIADLYERDSNSERVNIYRLGTLALLSGTKPLPSAEVLGLNLIEDYLFGGLWQALQHKKPMNELSKLGGLIRQFGPNHFGDQESGGWSYALPLLAVQQFRTALSYLADVGGSTGLLQATHLALALSLAGVPIADLGQDSSPECLVTALLVAYGWKLQGESSAGATAALEYFLRIPKKDRARKEIASLVVRSYFQQKLHGDLSPDGIRQDAILDKHLPRQTVSYILADAAEVFKKEAADRSKATAALMLFLLAGRHVSVLMLLNDLMAPPDNQDENRRFWCDQSQQFYLTYLAKRTVVIEALEREDKLHLVTTNQVLTNLRIFFEQVQAGRFDEGMDLMMKLDLLPTSKTDLSAKVRMYEGLEPVLKNSFPALLKGAMDCLYGLHRRVKSESHGITPTVQARLSQLQELASLQNSFAGFANLSGDMKDGMSRLEAHMV